MAPQTNEEEEKLGQPILVQPDVAAPTTQPPAQMAKPSSLQPLVSATPTQPQAPQPPAPKVQQFGPQAQQLQQPVSQPKTTTSTPVSSFTRLQQYLQTSQPQARGLGSTLQSQITSQAAAGRQALGQAAQSFGKQVEEAGLTRNEARIEELINKAKNLKAGQSLSEEEFKELEDIAKTKETFGGAAPADLTAMEDFAAAQANLGEAKERAGLTRTSAGLKTLLEDVLGKGRQYKSSESLLDAILTGSSKVPAEALTGLRSEYVDKDTLMKEQEAAMKAAEEKRAAEEAEIAAAVGDITSRVGVEAGQGLLGTMEKAIKDRIAAKNAQVEKVNRLIAQASATPADIVNFGDTDASKELINILHLTPDQVNQIRQTGGRNPSIFQTMRELNEQTGTTKDEFAELQALYRIGERFGRQAPRIQATEREDLGSLIDQEATVDWDKVTRTMQINAQEAKREKDDYLANHLDRDKIDDYRFGKGASVKDAAIDIYERSRSGTFRDDRDNPEMDKVINKMAQYAQDIANNYAARGLNYDLGRLSVSADDDYLWNNETGTIRAILNNTTLWGWNTWRRIDSVSEFMNDMRRRDPNLYNRIVAAAQKMAQIKKYAEEFGFFDKFQHIQRGAKA